MNDFRFALRRLAKNPGFTIVAVFTLALCLGANLTIISVVDAILVRALPFRDPERLAIVLNSYPKAGVERVGCSFPNYFDRRGAVPAFSSVSMFQEGSVITGENGNPRRVPILRITPEFFGTLGVSLAMGESFVENHLAYRADEVAILTDEFWRSEFQGDRNVIGRTFLNDGARIAVIGVLPRGFRFLSSRALFFRPLSHAPEDRLPSNRHSMNGEMIARLSTGIGWGEAQSQMDGLNARLLRDDLIAGVVESAGFRTQVRPLHHDHVRQVRRTLILLQAGVGCLLLIGLVNLANLLLIRANGRAHEFAVREALGAGKWGVTRDALAEIGLIVGLAGLLGLALGAAGLQLLNTLGADQLPLGASVQLGLRAGAAGMVTAVFVAVLLTALVVTFHWRIGMAAGLRGATRGGTSNRSVQRLHHGFVVAQVALAFVLLVGAGLLGVSLRRVLEAPTGFSIGNVLTGQIAFPWQSYTNQQTRLQFVDRLLDAVRHLPGMKNAAACSGLPFGNEVGDSAFAVEGHTPATGAILRAHYVSTVTADYWRTMNIPLLRGRYLEDADRTRQPPACVVDRAFAEHYWPGADPIGRRISKSDHFNEDEVAVVVGVVANVKQRDLAEEGGHGTVYLPYGRLWPNSFTLVVHSAASEAMVAPMLRRAVKELDPGMPIDDVRSLQTRVDNSLVARRSPALLAGVFAGVALLLAALGTYGVLAYAVSERQREIGVRMALGAQPRQVLTQFLGLGAKLCLLGLALGVAAAWAAHQSMQSILFGVNSFQTGVMLVAGGCLAAVVLVAILIPSRRASRVDPMEALRNE